MQKLFAPVLIAFMALFMPLAAFAQDAAAAAAPAVDQGLSLIPMIVEAARGGHWSVFVAAIIMVLVWGLTKAPILSDLIKGEAKVWVAAVCGVCVAIAAEAFTTGDWLQAILHGLGSGLAATGLWELVGKKMSGKSVVPEDVAAPAAK
jgi:hypothetical protein